MIYALQQHRSVSQIAKGLISIRKLRGHADIKTTHRYPHLGDVHVSVAAEAMADNISDLLSASNSQSKGREKNLQTTVSNQGFGQVDNTFVGKLNQFWSRGDLATCVIVTNFKQSFRRSEDTALRHQSLVEYFRPSD